MTGGKSVIVIGGGITGLTIAYYLRKAGIDVVVLEKNASPGGTMQTFTDGGWLVETGPNSALETTPLFEEMFAGLGIAGDRIYANPASDRRYILRAGRLHPLPMSFAAFLRTRLWSLQGKLRLLREPLIGRGTKDETIAEFVERRLGREFLDYAINPFVAGVYAGNPETLSVRAAFPKLYALEERYGGLVRGMIGGARERRTRAEKAKDRAKMFSFREGMQTFPRAIATFLGDAISFGVDVTGVSRNPDGQFRIECPGRVGGSTSTADLLVLAVPAYVAGRLVRPLSSGVADTLRDIYYPPVAEVFLGFQETAMTRPLDGFGYLIPAKERRKILGTIWSSALFDGRAPSGHVALTTFVGGSRQPELAGLGDNDLVAMVTSELHEIMGVRGDPAFVRVVRWPQAIPQYTIGYEAIVERIENLEKEVPGLYIGGNFRGGIAVGDCIMMGEKTARKIVQSALHR